MKPLLEQLADYAQDKPYLDDVDGSSILDMMVDEGTSPLTGLRLSELGVSAQAKSNVELETMTLDFLTYQRDGDGWRIRAHGLDIVVPEEIVSADPNYNPELKKLITEGVKPDKVVGGLNQNNPWSFAHKAFLALIAAIAQAKLGDDPMAEGRIRICRWCGRTNCPYHGFPDGYVYIKVKLA